MYLLQLGGRWSNDRSLTGTIRRGSEIRGYIRHGRLGNIINTQIYSLWALWPVIVMHDVVFQQKMCYCLHVIKDA